MNNKLISGLAKTIIYVLFATKIACFYYKYLRLFNDNAHYILNLNLDEIDKPRKMNNLKPIFTAIMISISFSLMGCSGNSQTNGTPALFETKAEAEKAAKNFNCTGAHKMGDKWMPCKSHTDHESHDGHHHHH